MDQAALTQQLQSEIGIINRTLAGLGIEAGTRPAWSVVAGSSYVAYGLRLAPAVLPSAVERAIPKLAEALSSSRRRPCPVRLRYMPLALEVSHPAPAPLYWRRGLRAVGSLTAGQALVGRRWDGSGGADDLIDLAASPHVLIAGTTGSGKSTLEIMLLASLAVSTPPAGLHLYLIDLKNEDLIQLAGLPHVRGVARDFAGAVEMVAAIQAEKDRRVALGRVADDVPRVVLAIDELGQLAGDPATLDRLGDVLQVGRSKRISVIAATQKPTAAIVGSQGRANFTTRLVGRVADATESSTATGRRGAGAEFLPGAGAFLRVDGADLYRLQAFDLAAGGVDYLAGWAAEKWPDCDADGLPVWGGSVNVYSAPGSPALPAARPAVAPLVVSPDLAACFAEYFDGAGGLVRGGKAAAVRVVAPGVEGGGAYQRAAAEVDRLFAAWLADRTAAPIIRMAAARG